MTHHQKAVIHYLLLSVGSFSSVCSLLVLSTILVFKKYRRTAQRVILYFFLTITIESLTYMLHGLEQWISNSNYCKATGFIDQVFSWMEAMAVVCLTFDLFFKVMTLRFDTERLEVVYFLLIFVFPLTFNWVPFLYDNYGESSDYCWIKTYKNYTDCEKAKYGYYFQFGIFWIPYYVVLLVMVVLYVVALCRARCRLKAYTARFDPQDKIIKEKLLWELHEYAFYPVIVALLHSVSVASRVADAIRDGDFYLELFHSLFILLEGPLLSFAFFLNSDTQKDVCVLRNLKAAIITFFCPCKMRKVLHYHTIIQKDSDSITGYSSDASSLLDTIQ